MSIEVEAFRRVLLIRLFEEAASKLQGRGLIVGAMHTSVGQEGEIVGSCLALRSDDYMVGNHRSHGHPLAKGADPGPLMAELLGKVTGVNRGKGGSMHLADFAVGSLGETSIVGSGLPVAAGAGLASKMRGDDRVTLCFFGDGASNQGAFHEALNLAAAWNLPIIWLCENNLYGSTTPISTVLAVDDIATRAAAYGIPGYVVDGQDAMAVHAVAAQAVARARRGEGSTLIEAKTYRFEGHAAGTGFADKDRDAEEMAAWRQRDPVTLSRDRLLHSGLATEADILRIETEVQQAIAEAVEFALNSDFPEPAEAFEGVYAAEASHV